MIPKNVILYFTAAWCGPCRAMSPIFENFTNSSPVKTMKIDVDRNSDLSIDYRITNIPTFIVVKDGTVINRHVGVQTMAQLETMAESILNES